MLGASMAALQKMISFLVTCAVCTAVPSTGRKRTLAASVRTAPHTRVGADATCDTPRVHPGSLIQKALCCVLPQQAIEQARLFSSWQAQSGLQASHILRWCRPGQRPSRTHLRPPTPPPTITVKAYSLTAQKCCCSAHVVLPLARLLVSQLGKLPATRAKRQLFLASKKPLRQRHCTKGWAAACCRHHHVQLAAVAMAATATAAGLQQGSCLLLHERALEAHLGCSGKSITFGHSGLACKGQPKGRTNQA